MSANPVVELHNPEPNWDVLCCCPDRGSPDPVPWHSHHCPLWDGPIECWLEAWVPPSLPDRVLDAEAALFAASRWRKRGLLFATWLDLRRPLLEPVSGLHLERAEGAAR